MFCDRQAPFLPYFAGPGTELLTDPKLGLNLYSEIFATSSEASTFVNLKQQKLNIQVRSIWWLDVSERDCVAWFWLVDNYLEFNADFLRSAHIRVVVTTKCMKL